MPPPESLYRETLALRMEEEEEEGYAGLIGRGHSFRSLCVNNDELCFKNAEFCIKNEELCIENEEVCVKNDGFCRQEQADPTRVAWTKLALDGIALVLLVMLMVREYSGSTATTTAGGDPRVVRVRALGTMSATLARMKEEQVRC